MTCRHIYTAEAGMESVLTIDASRVSFGPGALAEIGPRMRVHLPDGGRIMLVTDPRLRAHEGFEVVAAGLSGAGFEVTVYDQAAVEPTDVSFNHAVEAARAADPDGFVSFGGGSVIDTAKAADLLVSHRGTLYDYVNAPLGAGMAVPGPLRPHLAAPTTSGTGSEVTGIAIFDYLGAHAKTGVSHGHLRPTEAVVDPTVTSTLPANVVAASGLDVLCHALESLTARPFTARGISTPASTRPASQGANPWSDLGATEAVRLVGRFLRRAVLDAGDTEARHQMMWAATLAGIAFGNAGVHVPHAMAYAVAGRVRDYRPDGYPQDHPMVPHGFAVAVNAPAAFRALAHTDPDRHLEAAGLLGGDVTGAGPRDAGEVLGATVAALMRDVGAPNGVGGVGYTEADIDDLVTGAAPQRRLLDNAPSPIHEPELSRLFADAMRCW
ncbi:MAG: hydroxyacid-oxoacid transhydrogenase [Nocardioides sp.]